MQGWIKLHRQLLESLVFGNEKALKIWIWCLLKANHSKNEFLLGRKKIKINKGEFVMGLNKASDKLNLAKSTIKYWLDFLEKEGQVKLKKTNKYTIVKVLNWTEFQDVELKKNSKENLKETNKNDKNEKNEKNIEFSVFWDLYQKKIDKHKCELKWSKLKNEDREAVVKNVPLYIQANPDIKYRKNPLTYLNGRCWEDEIISNSKCIDYDAMGLTDYNKK